MEHTALKWEVRTMSPVRKDAKGMICVMAVNSPINATLAAIGTDEQAKANAEFIVRAVNSHDELVDALGNMISYLDFNDRGTDVSESAREAIAKATKEA